MRNIHVYRSAPRRHETCRESEREKGGHILSLQDLSLQYQEKRGEVLSRISELHKYIYFDSALRDIQNHLRAPLAITF